MQLYGLFEHSVALSIFGIGTKTDFFQSCGHCCIFQICWPVECSTFTASSFRMLPYTIILYYIIEIYLWPKKFRKVWVELSVVKVTSPDTLKCITTEKIPSQFQSVIKSSHSWRFEVQELYQITTCYMMIMVLAVRNILLSDSWESLGQQEVKLVNPNGNQLWIFIGRIDTEATVLWQPDVKSWLIGEDPDVGKDWGHE